MKLSKIVKSLQEIVQPYVDTMQFVCTINANEKWIRYPIEKSSKGLYAFYKKGANPKKDRPLYLGETVSCFLTRVGRHKMSLRDPLFEGELTGSKFNEYNLDRFQDIDVYFLSYEELISQYDSRTIEGLFKLVLKPIVFQ